MKQLILYVSKTPALFKMVNQCIGTGFVQFNELQSEYLVSGHVTASWIKLQRAGDLLPKKRKQKGLKTIAQCADSELCYLW